MHLRVQFSTNLRKTDKTIHVCFLKTSRLADFSKVTLVANFVWDTKKKETHSQIRHIHVCSYIDVQNFVTKFEKKIEASDVSPKRVLFILSSGLPKEATQGPYQNLKGFPERKTNAQKGTPLEYSRMRTYYLPTDVIHVCLKRLY